MKVSILVPVYGVEKFIEKCARSLFQQTYNDIEYVFVDDCSKDKSVQLLKNVIEEYPSRKEKIKIIRHEYNRGLSAARNTALNNCTGDFVAPFDSDDYLSECTAIEEMVQLLVMEEADVLLYDMQHIYSDKTYYPKVTIPTSTIAVVNAVLTRQIPVCLCGGLYKRDLFLNYNISSIEGLSMGEDYVVKPRLLCHAKHIIHLAKPFYCYVHTNESAYTQTFNFSRIKDLSDCISILFDYFIIQPDYNQYKLSLSVAATQTLSEMLINCSMGNGGVEDFKKVLALLPNACTTKNAQGWRNKIIIGMAAIKCYYPIKIFVRWGVKVKNLIK